MNKSIMIDGKSVSLYTIKNKKGMSADLCNLGAKIIRLYAPDKEGNFDDVVLGYDTLEEIATKETYFGAVCGRFANRIKGGRFVLDGVEYTLAITNGANHLHGGVVGYNARVWDMVKHEEDQVTFEYFSPDGEEGYPGNLTVKVTYQLTDDNSFAVHYEGTTDKPTVIGLTQHAYFNLKGAGNGTVRDHLLQINAQNYTVLDDTFALAGEIRPVAGTAFDFREPVLLDERIDDPAYIPGKGIDNNWCIDKSQPGECALAGYLYEPTSGRKMEVYTTQPGLQVYTANWVFNQPGKLGKIYDVNHSICLETQSFPNSPNIPYFPSSVLRPGEKYDEWCIYKFSVE